MPKFRVQRGFGLTLDVEAPDADEANALIDSLADEIARIIRESMCGCCNPVFEVTTGERAEELTDA